MSKTRVRGNRTEESKKRLEKIRNSPELQRRRKEARRKYEAKKREQLGLPPARPRDATRTKDQRRKEANARKRQRYASDPAYRERKRASRDAAMRKRYQSDGEYRHREKCRSSAYHKQRPEVGRGSYLRNKYGLTQAQFEEMLADQQFRCSICRTEELPRKRPWHIDHDHATQKVRGVLCQRCNVGLGMFLDSTAILAKAIEYLRSHAPSGGPDA